jgi:succinate dehydrogenase / fumarate reductase cytochrome b subunit
MQFVHRNLAGRDLSSLTLKAVMAVTGLGMAVWLTLHMLGNLTVLGGPELMNGYALKLRASGLLWPLRVVLAAACVMHVVAAIGVSLRSRAARPVPYARAAAPRAANLASGSMRWGGALLLLYLAYHVPHMYGVAHAAYVPGDVYNNLVSAMRDPVHALANVGIASVVALHLAHGLASALRTLGWAAAGARERRVVIGLRVWAAVVTLGFAVPPRAVWLGARGPWL